MGFFERWRRGESGGRGPSLFDPWSGPPAIQGIGAGRSTDVPALLRAAEGLTSAVKYDAALVIGLGPSGEQVLRALSNELALDPAGLQRKVKLVLLTTRPVPTQSLVGVPIRQFDLGRLGPTDTRTPATGSARAPLLDRFLHPAYYDPIALYFNNVQRDLRSAATDDLETRVIVVGSLGEPEIGLLGNLMLLLLTSSGGRGISRRVALLSIDSYAPELSPAEQEAALRELGRLTFLGPHVMPHQASQPDNASINALIDYFFLLQNAGGLRAPTASGADPLPFDLTVGQALAELTYLLLHPSGRDLWAHLQNDLATTGGARQLTHAPYLHTAGVATLFVPVTELQAYIAARLAQAAVFGERAHTPEGLLARRTPAVSYDGDGPALARAWLRQDGLAHRLTSGLLETTGPESFQSPPPVATDPVSYVPLLPAQVGHALAALFNDGGPDTFERAEAGLNHVQRYLANWINWCNAANNAHASDELRALAFILDQWQSQIRALRGQLDAWRVALGLDRPGTALSAPANPALSGLSNLPPLTSWGVPAAAPPRSDLPPLVGNAPRSAALPPLVGDGSPSTAVLPPLSSGQAALRTTAIPPRVSLRQLLQNERKQAEHRLQAVVGGGVRRPLTAEPQLGGFDGLSEAEKYYRDIIRPEIDQFLTTDSPHFRAITQRLYWWIKLTRSEPPELQLICLPADLALSADSPLPPDTATFGPNDGQRLVSALLDIAGVQAQKTAENLTAGWMLNRLRTPESRQFLKRAETVYLDYDARRAREQYLETLGARPYLIGPDVVTLDAVAGYVFPASVEGVERLDGAEPTRLTALRIQKDIPLQVVRLPQPTQQTYGQPTALYLYDQERLAAQYEARLSGGAGQGTSQFPPDFVVALTDADLVRLFCHGVMAGLIGVRVTDPLTSQLYWTVPFQPTDVRPETTTFPWEAGAPQTVPTRSLDDLDSDEWHVAGRRSNKMWLELAPYHSAQEWQSLWGAMRAFTLDLPYGRSLEADLIHPFHRDNRRTFLAALGAAIIAAHERPSDNEAMNRRVLSLRNRLGEWRRRYPNDSLALAFFTVFEIEMQRPGAL
jgi:hypothetical protein